MLNIFPPDSQAGVAPAVRTLLAGLGLALLPGLALAQPTITAFSPAANALGVPRTSPVRATFSQPLTVASAGALRVYSNQHGGLRSQTPTPALISGNTLTYTPPAGRPFMPGETVSSTVTRAAASTGGPLARPRVTQFTAATSPSSPGVFAGGSDPAVGNRPSHPVLADVDGDGDLDLLTSNNNSRSVSVRLNGGDATGSNTGVFSNGSESFLNNTPQSLAVGDVDGDGDLDFVVAEVASNGTVSVRLNGGDNTGSNTGVFSGGSTLSVGLSTIYATLGDVDGDGDLDLLYTSGPGSGLGRVVALLNGGNASGSNTGVFSNAAATAVNVGNSPGNIALGDVDGDGDLDLLTANFGYSGTTTTTVSVRLNGSDATGSNSGIFGGTQDVTVGTRPSFVALGDVDGDGDLDFVASNAIDNTVSVRLNGGNATGSNTGVFSAGSDLAVGTDPRGVTLGDIDGDGDLDLLSANMNGGVNVRLNGGDATGSNTGVFSGNASVAVGANPYNVALGDVDGDGDLDLVTANYNVAGTASVRLNGGVAVAPAITGFSPASGPVGTSITITGVRLGTATGLTMNGVAIPLANITANTGTSLTFTVPASATTGPITVTNAGGTSTVSTQVFTVTPSLSGLVTSAGTLSPVFAGSSTAYTLTVPGFTTSLTVTPTNAQTPGGTITVNGTAVPSGGASAPVALTPGNNTITVVVNAPTGGATTTYTLTVTRTPCAVTARAQDVSLTLNANGTATLTPAAFNNGSSSTCGAVTLSLSQTAFACTNLGSNIVTLTATDSFGGTATASAVVTVLAPPTATLTALTPSAAPAGTTVTATGTNLSGATALTVNGAAAPISNLTATGFSFVVPAGAGSMGSVVLTLPCGQTLSRSFGLLPTRAAHAAAPLTLYPNPAHGAVTVVGLASSASVQVLDALGRAVASGTAAADGTARLALPVGQPAGVYVVRSGTQALRLAVE